MAKKKNYFVDLSTSSQVEFDPDDAKRIDARYNEIMAKDPVAMLVTLAGIVIMIAVGTVVGTFMVKTLIGAGVGQTTAIVGSVIFLVPALLIVWFNVFPRIMRKMMRRALRDCGIDVCIGCGYDLRGHADSKCETCQRPLPCPECGRLEQPPLGEPQVD